MIVPNKTVVTYEGRVYGPGEWVPDTDVKEDIKEINTLNIDRVIDKVWDEKPKKCKK